MNTVKFVGHKHKSKQYTDKTIFAFQQSKKHHWLQKLAIWVLTKLQCYANVKENYLETYTIDKEKIVQLIMSQVRGVHMFYGMPPLQILIGSKTYHEFMGEQDSMSMLRNIDCSGYYKFSEQNSNGDVRTQILGIDVTIVPTMDGVIVLPFNPSEPRAAENKFHREYRNFYGRGVGIY